MFIVYMVGAILVLISSVILFRNDIDWSPKDVFILGYIAVFWPAVLSLLFGYFLTAFLFDE